MTREELKSRCEERAKAGDAAAAATLELFNEIEALKAPIYKAPTEALKKVVDDFVGVSVNGVPIDDSNPRPRANVPLTHHADGVIREPKPAGEPSADEAARINKIAKAFNVGDSEAQAIAATRAAHGLADTPDPLASAANPEMKTGGYEKIPGDSNRKD